MNTTFSLLLFWDDKAWRIFSFRHFSILLHKVIKNNIGLNDTDDSLTYLIRLVLLFESEVTKLAIFTICSFQIFTWYCGLTIL